MKKILLFFWATFSFQTITADNIEIDGLYYIISQKDLTAEVTENPNKYKGDIVIPSKIDIDGKSYKVVSIGEKAFLDCDELLSISIPETIKRIGFAAFADCYNLKKIILPDELESIGPYAFGYCQSLTTITIPNSTYFESSSFWGYSTFRDCTALESIKLPDNMTRIGRDMFKNCSQLNNIAIPQNVNMIEDTAFEGCSELSEITIPKEVTYIGTGAFLRCEKIKQLNIPDLVEEIAGVAFAGCKQLETIIIGKGIRKMNFTVFQECKVLKNVFVYSEIVPVFNFPYFVDYNPSDATLYVPENALLEYMTTNPWGGFGKFIKIETTGIGNIEMEHNIPHVYSINGARLDKLHRGINIIKMDNGKSKKLLLK